MSITWVDERRTNIAAPNTWHTLQLNQLFDTKNQLLDMMYMANGNKAYLVPLSAALERLELLIAHKLADPR